MSYDYHMFIHPVPAGTIIPKDTKVRVVDPTPYGVETFFTTQHQYLVRYVGKKTFYLTYDITSSSSVPHKLNSVIYNVHAAGGEYPVAVYQGAHVWSAFSNRGNHTRIFDE